MGWRGEACFVFSSTVYDHQQKNFTTQIFNCKWIGYTGNKRLYVASIIERDSTSDPHGPMDHGNVSPIAGVHYTERITPINFV